MRIPNLTHGSFFMLGAYLATSLIALGPRLLARGGRRPACCVAAFGGVVERLILRRLAGAELAQVLVTLGLSFMVADVCLMVWTGDPIRIDTPPALQGATTVGGLRRFPPTGSRSASSRSSSRWRCGRCSTAPGSAR